MKKAKKVIVRIEAASGWREQKEYLDDAFGFSQLEEAFKLCGKDLLSVSFLDLKTREILFCHEIDQKFDFGAVKNPNENQRRHY